VDTTQIRANASPDRTITREQLLEVAKVNRRVREYVEQVERENVVESAPKPPSKVAPADEEQAPKPSRTYRNSPPSIPPSQVRQSSCFYRFEHFGVLTQSTPIEQLDPVLRFQIKI
jgi:hypothetical protein